MICNVFNNQKPTFTCPMVFVYKCVCVCVFLPLLPRNMKMVDIVAQKMSSENDVHVARSFLMKILRSSMRYGCVAPSVEHGPLVSILTPPSGSVVRRPPSHPCSMQHTHLSVRGVHAHVFVSG